MKSETSILVSYLCVRSVVFDACKWQTTSMAIDATRASRTCTKTDPVIMSAIGQDSPNVDVAQVRPSESTVIPIFFELISLETSLLEKRGSCHTIRSEDPPEAGCILRI